VSQKPQNFLGLFRVPQFPLYLRNAKVLSHETSQSSADCSLTTGFLGRKSSPDFRETGPRSFRLRLNGNLCYVHNVVTHQYSRTESCFLAKLTPVLQGRTVWSKLLSQFGWTNALHFVDRPIQLRPWYKILFHRWWFVSIAGEEKVRLIQKVSCVCAGLQPPSVRWLDLSLVVPHSTRPRFVYSQISASCQLLFFVSWKSVI